MSQSTFPSGVSASSIRWPIATRGLDADAEVAGVVAQLAAVLAGKLVQRRPLLAVRPDVLALVLADRAPLGGGSLDSGELRRAGAADDQYYGVRR